jgi:hypothetical protein
MYASPERWFAVQNTGFMRDRKRQIILPAIAFRRTGMEKDETIPVDKMDPEDPKLHWWFERKYTDNNRYDAFSVQQGITPQREYYNVAVPDYMILSYDFIIWTAYIEQMNKLVERINWSAGSYWGEPNQMRFRTNIDSFTDSTEVSDRDRIVKTEFSVTLKGYLIPEAYNELIGPHTIQKYLTPKTLVINAETDMGVQPLMDQLAGGETFPDAAQAVTAGGTATYTLSYPLTISSGTGVTILNEGETFDGSTSVIHEISIGQSVASSSNVIFNQVTASSALVIGSSTFTGTGLDTDLTVSGDFTGGSLVVTGDATIAGNLIAQEFHTEYISGSIIFTSGSTQFGNTLDDTHYFTGSMYVTGSWKLGEVSVVEISDDTTLADSSVTSLITENAAKTYIDTVTSANADRLEYLRKQYVKISSALVGNNTASFTAVTASAPAAVPGQDALTDTTEHDFLFFINGQYMEHDALEIEQANGVFYLKVDTDSIGYELESDDEILAWGKFNS